MIIIRVQAQLEIVHSCSSSNSLPKQICAVILKHTHSVCIYLNVYGQVSSQNVLISVKLSQLILPGFRYTSLTTSLYYMYFGSPHPKDILRTLSLVFHNTSKFSFVSYNSMLHCAQGMLNSYINKKISPC